MMACYEVSFCHHDPQSLKSIYRMVQEEMSFEEFQVDHHSCHIRYFNWTNLANLKLHVALMPCTKFQFHPTYRFGDVPWKFHYGCHGRNLDYQNKTILTLHFPLLLPIKYGDVVWRISRWLPFWIAKSDSPCCTIDSHKFRFNPTYGSGDVFWKISRWLSSLMLEQNDLAILNLHVALMSPNKFQFKQTKWFERKCPLNNLKRLSWRPTWIWVRKDFSNSESPRCLQPSFSSIMHLVWKM